MRRLIVATVAACGAVLASGGAFAQAGDAVRGERVYATQCKACHTLERGGASLSGPNLYGLFARRSGTLKGYGYSEAMRRFAVEWDDKTLAAYLRDPRADMPGTKMVFPGIKRQDQLADVIVYLREATR